MSRASQSDRQLGDGLVGYELVDALADLFASEARQLGEQRCRIDFEHELAGATADHVAVWAKQLTQDLVEGIVVGAAVLVRSRLPQDVAQEVTGWSGLGQDHAPLIGMTT
jgi:hypothetical protein